MDKCYALLQRAFIVAMFLSLLAFVPDLRAEPMQKHETIDQSHPRVRLIVGSKKLHKKIHLTKAKVAPFGKLMRGQAIVQNITDKRLSLEYKVDWFDDEGFLVGDGGIWNRFAVGGREMKTIKSIGKSRYASRMQLTVRYPGDIFIDRSSRR